MVTHGTVVAAISQLHKQQMRQTQATILGAAQQKKTDDETTTALAAIPPKRALTMLNELAPSLTKPEHKTLNEIAQHHKLIAHAKTHCGARRWRTRLHTARVLTLHNENEQTMPPLLDNPHPEMHTKTTK